jgi:predicted ATPase
MAAKRVKSTKRLRKGPRHDQLLSVGLRSPALGPKEVAFEVESGITVLTGRNGVGKSAILEGLESALLAMSNRSSDARLRVDAFRCNVGFHDGSFSFAFKANGPSNERHRRPVSWSETATSSKGEALWSVSNGVGTVGSEEITLPSGVGLVTARLRARSPREMLALRRIAHQFELISSAIPRRAGGRQDAVLRRQRTGDGVSDWEPFGAQDPRLALLLDLLLMWAEEDKPLLVELERLGVRIGLWRSITYSVAEIPSKDKREQVEFGQVEIDGVDLGLLSDGTLRTIEILAALVDPMNRLLFVEEPESSIHPGLLSKLMTEIETYGATKQVLLSTHSPAVLQRVEPAALRLVTRTNGQTSVRSLKKNELSRVKAFLEDEGDLGEWLFGGGVSEE